MKNLAAIINNDWEIILKDEFQKKSFERLTRFLTNERKNFTVFPSEDKVFTAFKLSSFSKTKIIIMGQDPYHGTGQAHGLSFSVPKGIKPPPSLKNIFKELHADLNFEIPNHGNLTSWAQQGVLLLNATLTVREKQAASHQEKGWEQFTNRVITEISKKKEGVIFLLWGRFAQDKKVLIDSAKHHILTAPHPSPFSAHSGFFGCKHFSKANYLLSQQNQAPINWQI